MTLEEKISHSHYMNFSSCCNIESSLPFLKEFTTCKIQLVSLFCCLFCDISEQQKNKKYHINHTSFDYKLTFKSGLFKLTHILIKRNIQMKCITQLWLVTSLDLASTNINAFLRSCFMMESFYQFNDIEKQIIFEGDHFSQYIYLFLQKCKFQLDRRLEVSITIRNKTD